MDRKQVETIVRDYLLANPELLLEVQEALEAKQKEAQRRRLAWRDQGSQGRDLQF